MNESTVSWSELFKDLIVIIKEFAAIIDGLMNIAGSAEEDQELLKSPEAAEVFAAGKDLLITIISK